MVKSNGLTRLTKLLTVYVNIFSLLLVLNLALPQTNFGANPISPDKYSQIELKIKIGGKLPNLDLKKVEGGVTNLANVVMIGHKSIIVVWATWCPSCARLMPFLEKSRVALEANKINVIGINADTEKDAPVASFIADKSIKLPIYIGGIEADKRIFATREVAVPLTIFLDEKGNISDYTFGWNDKVVNSINNLSQ